MLTKKSQPSLNNQPRYEHVDSLRGIAALLVILLHVCESYVNFSHKNQSLIYDFSWYINTGRMGVVMFFAISGFVLLNSIKNTKSFLIKRFFRLYPAFWLSIILGVLVLQDNIPTLSALIANITMMPLMFDKGVIIGVYWTLESELIFYLLGLLLFIFGLAHNALILFFLSVFFLIVFFGLVLINFTSPNHTGLNVMPYHLAIMFWGGLFRFLYNQPTATIKIIKYSFTIKFLFIILTITLFAFPIASLLKGFYFSEFKSIQFGLANLLGLSLFITLTNYIKIKSKPMVWLGTISYSMYLFHPIIFSAILWCLKNLTDNYFENMGLILFLILNIGLTILFSSVIYLWVEKPFINYASKLIKN